MGYRNRPWMFKIYNGKSFSLEESMNPVRDAVLKMRLMTAFGVPRGRGECAQQLTGGVQGHKRPPEMCWLRKAVELEEYC